MSRNYDIVQRAIEQKLSITAKYGFHVREMCPHILGLSKTGKEQALFYQFGGTSTTGLAPSGSPDNWRCMPLDKLENLSLMAAVSWHTAPNHSRPQTCVKIIHYEVAHSG